MGYSGSDGVFVSKYVQLDIIASDWKWYTARLTKWTMMMCRNQVPKLPEEQW